MTADSQIRQQIFRKIRKIPASKLKDLNDYLSKLEQPIDKSSKILSFAGSWNNIDEIAFDELTNNTNHFGRIKDLKLENWKNK